ncbi:hypothetical protein JCM8097_004052 [Rhodosporidiobolus ruineniae]
MPPKGTSHSPYPGAEQPGAYQAKTPDSPGPSSDATDWNAFRSARTHELKLEYPDMSGKERQKRVSDDWKARKGDED